MDENYKELRPVYDKFVEETKKRRIKCMESVSVTYRYDVIPSSDPALAEEGIGEVKQKSTMFKKFDVYTLDNKTLSYPERFLKNEDVSIDTFDVRNDSPQTLISEYKKDVVDSTTMTFKMKSNDFFTKNNGVSYIVILLKSDQAVFDIRDGVGLAFGRMKQNTPEVRYTGWKNAGPISFVYGTGTGGDKLQLKDGEEYTVVVKVFKLGSTRKFQYSISGGGIDFTSAETNDPYSDIDYTFNDVVMFAVGKNANATDWSFVVSDVDIKRE